MGILFAIILISAAIALAHVISGFGRRWSAIAPLPWLAQFQGGGPIVYRAIAGVRWPLTSFGTAAATLPLARATLRRDRLQLGPSVWLLGTLIPRWEIDLAVIEFVRPARGLARGALGGDGLEVHLPGASLIVMTPKWQRLLTELLQLGVPAKDDGARQRWFSSDAVGKPAPD